MKRMGKQGQAFSTFKLLIAAIVAVVILVILLSILGYIDFSPRNKPVEGAAEAVKEAYQTPSQLAHSQSVTFTRNYVLPATTIIESADIGISEEQVCLSVGDYETMGDQFEGDAKKIVYQGGSPKTVKLSTLCYYGDEIEDLIENTYSDLGASGGGLDSSWVAGCDCVTTKQLCCLVALRIAR